MNLNRQSAVKYCCYAECCCPAWLTTNHSATLVDFQLNNTMRVISGCLPPAQNHCSPV